MGLIKRIPRLWSEQQIRDFIKREWLRITPMSGGTDFPSPIQTGIPFIYEGPPLPLPQTGTKTIFTMSSLQYKGGPGSIWIDAIWGVVTTAVGAVANATKLTFISTDNNGNTLTGQDACATADINGFTEGYVLSVAGVTATALQTNQFGYISGGSGFPRLLTFGTTGILQINCAGSDGGGGMIKWYLSCRASYGVRVIPAAS